MPTKTYNVDAYGIPPALVGILKGMSPLPLRYTRHAMREAVNAAGIGFKKTLGDDGAKGVL